MILVIDATVAVKWYVTEDYTDDAATLLENVHELHAPELILPEFGNILWKKECRGEISGPEVRKIIDAFQQVDITLHSHTSLIKAALVGASMSRQTVYDWTYLALAVSLSSKFVTADERFFNALQNTSMAKYLTWIGSMT